MLEDDVILGLSRPAPKIKTPSIFSELLQDTGIRINGRKPWDIQVLDERAYSAVLSRGSLGFGEAYMDGYWECDDLAGMLTRVLLARIDENPQLLARLKLLCSCLRSRFLNLQTPKRAFQVGEQHYDIGNDLYQAMLDPHWCYSCGYWAETDNLDAAQTAKLDLICRKLKLEPGMSVLEVGCGWGSLAHYMAQHYGVHVKGITISKGQAALATERCKGLPVDIELGDYREVSGQYDRIVSVGMFEHVGRKNYATYFRVLCDCLKPEGLFLLHTIGTEKGTSGTDPWLDRYIFPNGELPSLERLVSALPRDLVVEDLHNFGKDYDKTLIAWWNNFQQAWPLLSERYSERFARMWRYYLMSCAAFFRSGQGQLWQLVLSPQSNRDIYRSIR